MSFRSVRRRVVECVGVWARAPWAAPGLVVVAVGMVVVATGVRGADYPAHLFRAWLLDRSGPGVWNNHWYAGHPTPGYGVLAPALTAWFGPVAVVVAASLIATWAFSTLTASLAPGATTSIGNVVFALGAGVNIVVGRVPFAVGLALALSALLAWHRRRLLVAGALAVLTPLASPVAAVFLAIAAAAVAIDRIRHVRAQRSGPHRSRLREAVVVGAAAVAPMLAVAVSFGSIGRFPFRTGQLVGSLVVLGFLVWRFESRTVRTAGAVTAIASIVVWIVPNPLGGNFLRLAQLVGVPLGVVALAAVDRRGRAWFGLLAIVGTGWMIVPAFKAGVAWAGDASTDSDYHRPLIEQVETRNRDGRPIGRLEIPFTDNHWESWFVATEVPYARGWERQVDLERNEVLYEIDGDRLTIDEYHAWLHHNAVRWIARPDVDLDEGGVAEADIVDREAVVDVPWLRLVWQNENWRLFEVLDYTPVVEPPAVLEQQSTDLLVLSVDEPAEVTVRFDYDDALEIDGGACMRESERGWIVVDLPRPGTYHIGVGIDDALGVDDSDRCD